jgi:hypothetical protein
VINSGRRVGLSDGAAVPIDDAFEAALLRGEDGVWRIQRLSWQARLRDTARA